MPRDPEAFLHDMKDSASFVRQLIAGRTFEDFETDRAFRSAVERELMIVGEALYQLDSLEPDLAARVVDYRRIIDFRHLVVQGYYKLDPQIVWGIVSARLEPLLATIEVILRERGGPS